MDAYSQSASKVVSEMVLNHSSMINKIKDVPSEQEVTEENLLAFEEQQ